MFNNILEMKFILVLRRTCGKISAVPVTNHVFRALNKPACHVNYDNI